MKRIILVLFLFLYSYLSFAIDPIWTDEPIAYKRNYSVSTYYVATGIPNLMGGAGYYSTYIIDSSPQAIATGRTVIHCVMSHTQDFARNAHEQARHWLVQRFAHLRVDTDLIDNRRLIDTPAVPSQRTRVPFAFPLAEPGAPGPEITPDENERQTQSEPTTQSRKRKLEDDAHEQEEYKMRIEPQFQDVTPPPTLPTPPSFLPQVNIFVPFVGGAS